MKRTFELRAKVAVVTGAAGGIGRAIALSLARRGCHLALADIDETGLGETAKLVGDLARVSRHPLDVSDIEAVAALPAAVIAAHGQVDVLVNNAGVALSGRFDQLSADEYDWLIDINFNGVVRMTRAFLPLLATRDEARLVNLSSLFGLIAPPGQTAYSAAKFAVRGFSESLRNELLATGSPVGVTVVHPGGVKTGIARNARVAQAVIQTEQAAQQNRFATALRMSPDEAGEVIVRGVERRRPRVLVGSDARIVSLVERLAPVNYWRLLDRMR